MSVWSCVCVEVQPLSAVCFQSVEAGQPLLCPSVPICFLSSVSSSFPPLTVVPSSSHVHIRVLPRLPDIKVRCRNVSPVPPVQGKPDALFRICGMLNMHSITSRSLLLTFSSCPSCQLPPVIIVAPPATADAVIIIAVVGRSLHQGCAVIWTNCDEMSSLLQGWKTLVGTHGAGSGIKNVEKKGKGNIVLDVFLDFASCGC